jgi:hypothetical protein
MSEMSPIRGSLKNIIKELQMRKSKEKAAHSKFFPEDNQFVNLQGNYWDHDNWEVNVTIGGGSREQVYLWVTDYDKNADAFLNEIATAVSKAQDAVAKFRNRAKVEATAAKDTKAAKIAPKKKK